MIDKLKIEKAVRDILEAIGEDVSREGLVETPRRVANMYEELFGGIGVDPKSCAKIFYEKDCQDIVIVKDISFASMCEHHLLPFFGVANIVYIPKNNKIMGLSKFCRIVDVLSKRPQLQERLTFEISDAIYKTLKPAGLAVILKATHTCMTIRGNKKVGSQTVTSDFKGILKTDESLISKALTLLK
ncbi:MAG: GTP cyclohydrolase I FolE [Oscillospiraceae bacterium]|nr:GTP cyclohydrolase I FolE [Oscillospiraceae bacterium]